MSDFRELEKENKENIKGKGRGRLVLGLLLIVVAVVLVSYRSGFFDSVFDGRKTNEEYLAEEINEKMKGFDKFWIEEVSLMSEGKGTAVGKVQLRTNNLLNLLLGNTEFDLHYTENGYAITEVNTNIELASVEFDYSSLKKLAASEVLKSSAFKKLLEKYRLIYYEELFKDRISSRNDNYINNLDGVILVETEMKFELSAEDYDRAMEACLYAARKDKTLKKAYKALAEEGETYDEFLDKLEESIGKQREKAFGGEKISGAFYINVSEGLTMADITTEALNAGNEPITRHIKAGYTYLNREVGFVLDYDDGTSTLNVLGSGIYNEKNTSFNTTGTLKARGPKIKEVNGYDLEFVTRSLQFFRAGEMYASGTVLLEYKNSEKESTIIEFESKNGSQTIDTTTVGKNGSRNETTVYITR
ncbi:MAG: hypothetical protein IJS80_04595 [Lachnospiraceae bacterium]|nr:hypothetical protein [Lachnospiraceae bacterium]